MKKLLIALTLTAACLAPATESQACFGIIKRAIVRRVIRNRLPQPPLPLPPGQIPIQPTQLVPMYYAQPPLAVPVFGY